MKIHIDKYYRTRDGRKVRIYATDGRDERVHGAVLLDDGWQADLWNAEGHYRPSKIENRLDIVAEWQEPKLRPWRAEEVPIGAQMCTKDKGIRWLIAGVNARGLIYVVGDQPFEPQFVLEHFQHSIDGGKTWLPCGVEE